MDIFKFLIYLLLGIYFSKNNHLYFSANFFFVTFYRTELLKLLYNNYLINLYTFSLYKFYTK